MLTGLVTISGQGNGSSNNSLMQVPNIPSGNYQPMECESSPRHTSNRRQLAPGYLSTTTTIETSNTSTISSSSMQSLDNNSRIQSSLGTIILPAMITSPMIQQQNYYKYGYQNNDSHTIVGRQQTTTTVKQRDPEREDSPMVGVCVQQSPVAIH